MLGIPKDKANLDGIVGELCREINRRMRMGRQLKAELDAYTDAQLTAVGYSAGEVAQLRTIAADCQQLANIYEGSATLPAAKDFRASFRPGWGVLGDF